MAYLIIDWYGVTTIVDANSITEAIHSYCDDEDHVVSITKLPNQCKGCGN